MKFILDYLQRFVSKSSLLVWLFVKIRNQANKIIGYHICYDHFGALNGEDLLLKTIIRHEPKTIFDVGANKGDWAAFFLSSKEWNGKIIMIEPGVFAFDKILSRFGGDDRALAFNIGFSNCMGYATFYEELSGGEKSSFLQVQTVHAEPRESVQIQTVDYFISQNNLSEIDLLKIDCEGLDFNVVRGASEMLKIGKIKVIQFEYSRDWVVSGNTLKACFRFFEDFGYSVYLLSNKGLKSFPIDYYGEFFSYANFVAVHPDAVSMVKDIILEK